MKVRMGAIRTLGLATATTVVAAGLGLVVTPSSYAADPVLPGPTSSSWTAVQKGGVVATDPTNDMTTGYLNLTPAGGALGTSTAYISADLQYAYFRFHVAQEPGATAGGYVVQFDTNNSTAGWEQAIRYDSVARTVTLYSTDPNSGVKAVGTAGVVVPPTQTGGTSYAGADGGAHVAFAVPRSRLTDAGIKLGGPMVMGTTSEAGVGLNAGGLLGAVKADIVGTPKFGLGTPAWTTLDTDPIAIDSDGDAVADNIDNCPVNANPGQEDDDEAVDNSLPPGTIGQPDGTEGQGNVCDRTPRGYDLDDDNVGSMDDQCPERAGLQANGCVARSITTAILRYLPRATKFTGVVRADYGQCVPRRGVSVFKFVVGAPDRFLGAVKTGADGRYTLDRRKRAEKGKYYAQVDRKSIFDVGVNCFAVKSPKVEVR